MGGFYRNGRGPYFRVFNPWVQGRRFDPEALFIKAEVPELRDLDPKAIHDPRRLATARGRGLGYPAPIVDHSSARQRAIEAFQG